MITSQEPRGKDFENAAHYGTITIQLEKAIYSPGNTISGNIYVTLHRTISSNEIILKVKGKETVHVFDQEERTISHIILKPEKVVYQGNLSETGQYVVPFSFLLPENIPGTFFQQDEKFLASIFYYIEAVIRPVKAEEPKIKYKHRFVVLQEIAKEQPESLNEIQTALSNCCFSKGSNLLKVRPEKAGYVTGGLAQVAVELDNTKSSMNCKTIRMQLNQILTLKLREKNIVVEVTKIERSFQGVQRGQVSDNQLVALNLPPLQEGNLWEIKAEGNLKEYLSRTGDVSRIMNTTTRGKIITSEFHIEVYCEMDSKWTAHPEIEVPIEILHPGYREERFSLPTNWNPRILGNVNVGLSVYNRQSEQPSALDCDMSYNYKDMRPSEQVQFGFRTSLPLSVAESDVRFSLGNEDSVM